MKNKIIIGTRGSKLALIYAEKAKNELLKNKLINNIDPSLDSGENIIPSSSENILSLFIGSRAARFFSKSKEIDKDKYGFEKRI